MVRHIDLLGILFVVCGAFQGVIGLVLALLYSVMGVGMGAMGSTEGDEEMMMMGGFMGGVGMLVACSVLVFAIPNVFVGIGLRRRARWARIAGLVLGALALPSVPFGTALGIFALVVLVDHQVGLEFEKATPA